MNLTIGILSLQGGFSKHADVCDKLQLQTKAIRLASDLENISALILPGGESTTIIKLIQSAQLLEPIKKFAKTHAVFGTCAGSILMATKIENFPFPSIGLIDMTVMRNAYGRQIASFHGSFDFNNEPCNALFIRAPKFHQIGPNVQKLAYYNGECIAIRQGKHLAISCHPELIDEVKIHQYFVNQCIPTL